jgi:iron complex outermembrane receptor protein
MSARENGRLRLLGISAMCSISMTTMVGEAAAQGRTDASASGLEEIVVTARKTTENIQDVPVTINVLTARALEQSGAANLSQIGGMTSNLVWDDRGGSVRNRIVIRGIGSNETNTGIDPGVGFYVDDVYIAHGIAFNQSLLDIDQVEVIKGPQGTLFGRNTIAGVISIHTRRPSTQEQYVDVAAAGGSYGLQQYRAVANVPLSDTMALKASGIYREMDGYSYDVVSRNRVNGQNHYGGRVQFLYQPSSTFDLIASAEYFQDDAPQDLPECLSGPGSLCATGTNIDRVLEATPPNSTEREMWGASVTANWTPADWGTLTWVTAYRHLTSSEFQDQDSVELDVTHSGFDLPQEWQFSQELRLATPQDLRLRGVFGAYYLHEDREASTPQTFTPLGVSIFNGGPPPAEGVDLLTLNTQVLDTAALFAQGSYDVTSRFTAELGLRYTYDTKDFDYEQLVSGTDVCPTPAPPAPDADLAYCSIPRFQGTESWDALSGTASLLYHLTDTVMPFVRFSRGYKSGGWNGNQTSPGTDITRPYDPEYLNSYEVGLKFESEDHALRLNVAGFYNDYSDLQLRIQDPVTMVQFVANAGEVTTKGAELELSWAALDSLQIDASVGVTRSHVDENRSSTSFGPELPFAPKTTASLTASYDWDLTAGLRAVISAGGVYRSDIWLTNNTGVSTSSNPAIESEAQTLVNAHVGVEEADRRWGVYVSGQNLTAVNRMAFYAGGPFQAAFPNAPRTWQVELKARF